MLAETASWSWVWRPGSMLAGSMWPKRPGPRVADVDRAPGRRRPAAGTKKVSSPKRARGWGASMSAQRAGSGPGLRAAWATPTGTKP